MSLYDREEINAIILSNDITNKQKCHQMYTHFLEKIDTASREGRNDGWDDGYDRGHEKRNKRWV